LAFSGPAALRLLASARVSGLLRQCAESFSQLQEPIGRRALRAELAAATCGVTRLVWLWHAQRRRDLSLLNCLEHWARVRPDAKAISDENESVDWATLRNRTRAWARALRQFDVNEGSRVAVVASNSVRFVTALLAIHAAGGIPVLLDPRSPSSWLLELTDELQVKLVLLENRHERGRFDAPASWRAVEFDELQNAAAKGTSARSFAPTSLVPRPFAFLLTSGSTGVPKTVAISNARAVLSGFGMAGFCLALTRNDSIYCVLPLTHATALMTALCPALVSGCALVLRRRFSPSEFWRDIAAENVSCLIYVGELARALLSVPSRPEEAEPRLRVAYGNGMSLDVWHRFQAHLKVARIVEYYGATELPLALVNLAGEPGYIGRIALGQFSPWRVVARDTDTGELVRDAAGTCVECSPGMPGEFLLANPAFLRCGAEVLAPNAKSQHMQWVPHVVTRDDAGIRTGDIVRRDSNGYVKFEDRTFEIFRQQGHNVSSRRLVKILRACSGVVDVELTHLALPHYDGQLGLAVIVPAKDFELATLAKLFAALAPFERARFVRFTKAIHLNRNLKFDHGFYRSEGIDPAVASEPSWIYQRGTFERVTPEIWAQLHVGELRF